MLGGERVSRSRAWSAYDEACPNPHDDIVSDQQFLIANQRIVLNENPIRAWEDLIYCHKYQHNRSDS